MDPARRLAIWFSLAALAGCGSLGSMASLGSLGSQGSAASSQGSGASSSLFSGGDAETGAAPEGRVCGNSAIIGTVIPAIEGDGTGSCSVPDAVQVTSVSGVALSPAARMSCTTAVALEDWVSNSVTPEMRNAGARLEAINVASDYTCGPADGPGHGNGLALDISGFVLASGETLSVAEVWDDPERGGLLRRLHQRACGPFTGTLGPWTGAGSSNALHYDVSPREALYCR